MIILTLQIWKLRQSHQLLTEPELLSDLETVPLYEGSSHGNFLGHIHYSRTMDLGETFINTHKCILFLKCLFHFELTYINNTRRFRCNIVYMHMKYFEQVHPSVTFSPSFTPPHFWWVSLCCLRMFT
jgi:hypothetical protein